MEAGALEYDGKVSVHVSYPMRNNLIGVASHLPDPPVAGPIHTSPYRAGLRLRVLLKGRSQSNGQSRES